MPDVRLCVAVGSTFSVWVGRLLLKISERKNCSPTYERGGGIRSSNVQLALYRDIYPKKHRTVWDEDHEMTGIDEFLNQNVPFHGFMRTYPIIVIMYWRIQSIRPRDQLLLPVNLDLTTPHSYPSALNARLAYKNASCDPQTIFNVLTMFHVPLTAAQYLQITSSSAASGSNLRIIPSSYWPASKVACYSVIPGLAEDLVQDIQSWQPRALLGIAG